MKIHETNIDGALVHFTPDELKVLRSAICKESSARTRRYSRINPSTPDELLTMASDKVAAQTLKVGIITLIQVYQDWGVLK